MKIRKIYKTKNGYEVYMDLKVKFIPQDRIMILTQELIDEALRRGILEYSRMQVLELEFGDVIRQIGCNLKIYNECLEVDTDKVKELLCRIDNLGEICSAQIFFKAASKVINNVHTDSIENYDTIYAINSLTGKVFPISTKKYSWVWLKSIAYFRTEAEANMALKLIQMVGNE